MPDFAAEVMKFEAALAGRLTSSGSQVAEAAYQAALPQIEWLDYLRQSETTGVADEFLTGLRASIVEALGCLASGLVRPAMFAMRGQIDIALGWLYFKDHPVEWEKVIRTGDGFMLKRDVVTYLEENIPSFRSRFSALFAGRTRSEADPYRLLSAYVHGQSPATLPVYEGLETLLWKPHYCADGVKIQEEVSEYINDVLLAYFGSKWASIPSSRVSAAEICLGSGNVVKAFT